MDANLETDNWAVTVTRVARRQPWPRRSTRRRWFVAVDPVFEAGRHGASARTWDVNDELVAVAFGGDVTLDLSQPRTAPTIVSVAAFAIFRDVDIWVAAADHVELSGGAHLADRGPAVTAISQKRVGRVIRVRAHRLIGDVTVRTADHQTITSQNMPAVNHDMRRP